MAKSIGIVGVPAEELYVSGDMGAVVTTYIPGITDKLRKSVIEECTRRGIAADDLGEAYLGEDYEHPYPTDRHEEVPEMFLTQLKNIDFRRLLDARNEVIRKSSAYDLQVAVGHSHLGAIVLYEDLEPVARLDYHGDYCTSFGYNYQVNFACYMNWVKENILLPEVINYFVTSKRDFATFGEKARGPEDRRYMYASHFDIDVDCVDESFRLQDCYSQAPELGGPTGVSPDDIVRMVSEARPDKIGFWEYRLSHDRSGGLGIKMIADCIEAAVK